MINKLKNLLLSLCDWYLDKFGDQLDIWEKNEVIEERNNILREFSE